jgi:diaminopimelate decarboxylase
MIDYLLRSKNSFRAAGRDLYIGDFPISRIAEEQGTPFYAYNKTCMDERHRLLSSALPPEFSIYYSIKANPNRAILRIFLSKGCGLEISSAGELYQAMQAGCTPESIVFAGPGKTDLDLTMAIRNGVGEIHAESILEIKRISKFTADLGIKANVSLRINPSGEVQGGAMRMGGKPIQFGMDEEIVDEALDLLLAMPSIEFQGIHLFIGTQILDASILLHQYRIAAGIARRIADRTGGPIHTVDLGGGLGIPYFPNDRDLDIAELRTGLSAMMIEIRADARFNNTRFIIEPGRYLVGDSGLYVTRVIDMKVSRGKKFVVIDGGMNHHLAASGNLGQTIKRNFPMAVANKMDIPAIETVDVVGPLCTPLDTLARSISLPPVEVGDLLVFFQSGAYSRTASPLGFLSHPSPPEILVDGEKQILIRRRGEFEDLTRDVPPESENARPV